MEYECSFQDPISGANYDFISLCSTASYDPLLYPYQLTVGDKTYVWNICGTAPTQCIPTWRVVANQGNAVQVFNDGSPSNTSTCTDVYGNPAACTANCELLAVGPPSITLYDPNNSGAGVNITHYGVRTLPGSDFPCDGIDPATGFAPKRTATQVLLCDPDSDFRIGWVREFSTCQYEIVMYTSKACPCYPSCFGRNCGPGEYSAHLRVDPA